MIFMAGNAFDHQPMRTVFFPPEAAPPLHWQSKRTGGQKQTQKLKIQTKKQTKDTK
jgi:hypothetical protein